MTPNQTLILRRLKEGPAGTAELAAMLHSNQCNTHKSLQRLQAAGLIKNCGVPWRASWELEKQ